MNDLAVKFDSFLFNRAEQVLSIFRIVAAFMFMQHGGQKLFGFPIEPRGEPPMLFSLLGLAGVLEVFGGFLLLIGLFTRPVAFVLSGLMAFAYFMAHAPRGFWTIGNGGDTAVLYCFAFLYLAAVGGGSWSLDHLRRGKA